MICETTLPLRCELGRRRHDHLFPRQRRIVARAGRAVELRRPSSSRTSTKGELKFFSPQILPGDEAILFTVTHTPFPTWDDDTEVVVQVLASGERKVLVHGGADARYLPSGHLLYLRKSTLMAVPFDLQQSGRNRRGRRADPGCHAISEHAERGVRGRGGSIQRLRPPGRSSMRPAACFPIQNVRWRGSTGTAQRSRCRYRSRPYASPRLSPDGQRFLVWTQGDRNVWVHDLSRGVTTRLTFEGRNARADLDA